MNGNKKDIQILNGTKDCSYAALMLYLSLE